MPTPLVRWVFDDPVTLDTYTFEINPSDGGTPAFKKKFAYQSTSAADGKTVIFEGRDEPQKIDFSGTILTQAHYDAFVAWWSKRYQIRVTDDLARQFYIVIEVFEPTRKRSIQYPWKHDYKVSATVVDWP